MLAQLLRLFLAFLGKQNRGQTMLWMPLTLRHQHALQHLREWAPFTIARTRGRVVAAARVMPEGATKKNVEKAKAAQEEACGTGTLK